MSEALATDDIELPPFLDRREMFKPIDTTVPSSFTKDDWRVITPVPDDAPRKLPEHRLGKPSTKWAYRDAEGKLLFLVCRFDTPDGKEVLPLTYGEDAQGKRWRWKGFPAPRPLYGLDRLGGAMMAPVIIVEGEKPANAAQGLFPDYVAITSPGGSKAAHKADWRILKGRQVVIWPDNDEPGRAYAEDVSRLAQEVGAASVRMVSVPKEFPASWDVADPVPADWEGRLPELLEHTDDAVSASSLGTESKDHRRLRAVNVGEFLSLDIPEREMVLAPVLPTQGMVMLYACRGVGKTFAALAMAYAVASGGIFLRWQAPKPRRVLYVDGEMPATAMQERIAQAVQGSDIQPPDHDFLRLITPDLQDEGIPDISTTDGQDAMEEHLEGVELVVIDNLSTLCRYGRENEAESWEPMQAWLLSLRRRGISVLLVHHAGKGGNQRGTSKREDTLDTVICLKRPEDYSAEEGARFEVHLEKARGIAGEDARPFDARMEIRDGMMVWTTRDIEDCEAEMVRRLTGEGLSVREIATETGFSKSKVNRLQNRAVDEGLRDAV